MSNAGRNLLRSTNNETTINPYGSSLVTEGDWRFGTWTIGSGTATNGTVTQSLIAEGDYPLDSEDNPVENIRYLFSVDSTNTGNKEMHQAYSFYGYPFFQQGATYTLSGWRRVASDSSAATVKSLLRLYNGTARSYHKQSATSITSTTWQRFSWSFTITVNPETNNLHLDIGIQGKGKIQYCGLKLEYGAEATDWSPAWEDVAFFPDMEMDVIAQDMVTVTDVVDITSYTRYYLLQSSTLDPPSAPTTATPGGSWVTTEPTYTEGSTNSLYFVDKTTFSDGTFSYSGVSLSSEYEAAKTAYNLAHTANTAAGNAQTTADTALAQSTEYIAGTQAAATNSWTGVTQDATLEVGKTIAYKLPYAGNSSNASLTLTLATGQTTAAVPVYLNTTRVTTHFGAGAVINMTYDGAAWRASSIPNTNTNNYDRRLHNDNILAATAITKNYLIVGTDVGYKNLAASVSFDLSYPILWASAAIAAAASAKTTYEAYPAVPFSTSGTIQSGAAAKMLYLKGTVSGNTFTVAASNYLTTVIPTSADGFYYIPLGVMTSATAGYFATSNRLFAYLNGSFQAVDTAAAGIAATTQSDLAAHKNYFWHDSNGAHISDTAGVTTGKNVLIDSNGMQIKDGSNVLAEFEPNEVSLMSDVLRIRGEVTGGTGSSQSNQSQIRKDVYEETATIREELNFGLYRHLEGGGHRARPGIFIRYDPTVTEDDEMISIISNWVDIHNDGYGTDNKWSPGDFPGTRMNANGFRIVNEYCMYREISLGTNRTLYLIRNGKIIQFRLHYNGAVAAGTTSLGQIVPEGFRPNGRVITPSSKLMKTDYSAMTNTTECMLRIMGDGTGTVYLHASAAADNAWFYNTTIHYFTNDAWPATPTS